DAGRRRLTYAASDEYEPDWAPDGSRFVFVTTRWATYGHLNLAVYDTVTRRVQRVTGPDDDSDVGPVWGPDGSRIAFMRNYTGATRSDLCVIDVDGRHQRCWAPTAGAMRGVLGWQDAH